MSLYQIIFIFANAFNTYITFRFISMFFNREKNNKLIEFITYSIFCVGGILIHFFVTVPIVMMSYNIVGYFLITFNYKGTLKKRFFVVILMFSILVMIEMLMSYLTMNLDFSLLSKTPFNSVPGLIAPRIVCFAAVLAIGNIKVRKDETKMPLMYWISIILLPVASIIIAFGLFEYASDNLYFIAVSCVLILGINFMVFHLYQQIIKSMENKLEQQSMMQQNEYYKNELLLIQKSVTDTASIRHDMKSHLTTIYGMLQQNDVEGSLNHIEEIISVDAHGNLIANSGNIVVDSIINFKLQQAEANNINVSVDLSIPKRLSVHSYDIAVIMGNLIDNALEAVLKIEEERFIDISIVLNKGVLVIKMENSFDGMAKQVDEKFLSSKRDYQTLGLGIKNINSIISKYNGVSEFTTNENTFCSKVLLYS